VRSTAGDAGFTLFEVLATLAVLAFVLSSVAISLRSTSSRTELKTSALSIASRLRDLRAAAIMTGRDQVAGFDVAERSVRIADGRPAIVLDRNIAMSATGAADEQASDTQARVRFFPNGSSTGLTLGLSRDRQLYEVRVNWLTGRVSTHAVD
jgi:general secretion pathway protein H